MRDGYTPALRSRIVRFLVPISTSPLPLPQGQPLSAGLLRCGRLRGSEVTVSVANSFNISRTGPTSPSRSEYGIQLTGRFASTRAMATLRNPDRIRCGYYDSTGTYCNGRLKRLSYWPSGSVIVAQQSPRLVTNISDRPLIDKNRPFIVLLVRLVQFACD